MPKNNDTLIAFASRPIRDRLAARLQPGESVGLAAARYLERYFAMLDHSRSALIVTDIYKADRDRLAAVVPTQADPNLLWAYVQDALDLGRIHVEKPDDFVLCLKSLSMLDKVILLDHLDQRRHTERGAAGLPF